MNPDARVYVPMGRANEETNTNGNPGNFGTPLHQGQQQQQHQQQQQQRMQHQGGNNWHNNNNRWNNNTNNNSFQSRQYRPRAKQYGPNQQPFYQHFPGGSVQNLQSPPRPRVQQIANVQRAPFNRADRPPPFNNGVTNAQQTAFYRPTAKNINAHGNMSPPHSQQPTPMAGQQPPDLSRGPSNNSQYNQPPHGQRCFPRNDPHQQVQPPPGLRQLPNPADVAAMWPDADPLYDNDANNTTPQKPNIEVIAPSPNHNIRWYDEPERDHYNAFLGEDLNQCCRITRTHFMNHFKFNDNFRSNVFSFCFTIYQRIISRRYPSS